MDHDNDNDHDENGQYSWELNCVSNRSLTLEKEDDLERVQMKLVFLLTEYVCFVLIFGINGFSLSS